MDNQILVDNLSANHSIGRIAERANLTGKQILFLLALFSITSCDKKQSPKPATTDKIVGTWQLAAIEPEKLSASVSDLSLISSFVPCVFNLKLSFNGDHSIGNSGCASAVTAIDDFVPLSGESKWHLKNDSIIISRPFVKRTFGFTQTGTDLTIIVNMGAKGNVLGSNTLFKFKRE